MSEERYKEGVRLKYFMDKKIYRVKTRSSSMTILEEEEENCQLIVKGESYLKLFFQPV